jgi:hypothetical protein
MVPASAEAIDNAISRDAEQPRACVLDRTGQAVRFDEFEQHVLQDVFRLSDISHAAPDETREPRRLTRDDAAQRIVVVVADSEWTGQ